MLLSRAVGKPVRVQWSRADEHIWEPKGPQQLMKVRVGTDAGREDDRVGVRGPYVPVDRSAGCPAARRAARSVRRTRRHIPRTRSAPCAVAQLADIPNQKVTAAYVPWPQDDPTPLRNQPAAFARRACRMVRERDDG